MSVTKSREDQFSIQIFGDVHTLKRWIIFSWECPLGTANVEVKGPQGGLHKVRVQKNLGSKTPWDLVGAWCHINTTAICLYVGPTLLESRLFGSLTTTNTITRFWSLLLFYFFGFGIIVELFSLTNSDRYRCDYCRQYVGPCRTRCAQMYV